jgi:ribosomal protein L2
MFFKKNISKLADSKFQLKKKYVTSGGLRNIHYFRNVLPLNLVFKKLKYKIKWKAGRNTSGRVVLRTRKSKPVMNTKFMVNYSFRTLNIGFIANIILLPFCNKLISLMFLSSGLITYLPTASSHKLFLITKFNSILASMSGFKSQLWFFNQTALFEQLSFILKQLPLNSNTSLLELLPLKGIQYVRSSGSSAVILKSNTKSNTALIKLPSGVKKVFSLFSLASLGSVALGEKKLLTNNKAGYYKNFGKKSIVRGVAMNPVDHPHGGRAKSIKYPRTP